jgi:SnoaL-like domain
MFAKPSSTMNAPAALLRNGHKSRVIGETAVPRAILPVDSARALAQAWIDSWNTRDLTRLAALYADDCEVNSPVVVTYMGEPSGRLRGKACILGLWRRLFEREEPFRCELFGVFRGVRSDVIYHRCCLGKIAIELMFFDTAGLICRSFTHFDQF